MPNNGGVYTWSQTPANNATADNTVNYAEGQAPSSLNDSARAAMASVAKYRDDISGAIVTTGTSTAYIVSSFQQFDSLANMHQKVIAFSPHATNGAGPVTISVDGFSKALRSAPNTELLAGVLIQGTPYLATYNNTDGAWYLQGFYGNPYNVPLLGGMDYWDTIAPNSSFIFPAGQAISRTTYAATFARWGTKYGAGDGSTTFNVPDKTGRVSAMVEAVATRLTSAGGGVDGGTIGASGGLSGGGALTLTASEIPSLALSGSVTVNTGNAVPVSNTGAGTNGSVPNTGSITAPVLTSGSWTYPASLSTTSTLAYTNASPSTVKPLPPMIVCNYIIRII